MKTLSIILPAGAFVFSIFAAIDSQYSHAGNGVFGHTSTGQCVEAGATVEEGCSTNNFGPQCTVWIPGSALTGPNQFAPAYSIKLNQVVCVQPLRLE